MATYKSIYSVLEVQDQMTFSTNIKTKEQWSNLQNNRVGLTLHKLLKLTRQNVVKCMSTTAFCIERTLKSIFVREIQTHARQHFHRLSFFLNNECIDYCDDTAM